MIFPRRLINLAGTLAVAGGLVAGTLLIALPVYIESIETRNRQFQVAASNQLLVAQIEGLSAKQAELPELVQELEELRGGLPRLAQLEDVTELTIRAAARTDATIESVAVAVSDPVPFAMRGPDEVLASLPKTAADVSAEAPAADGSPTTDPTGPPGDTEAKPNPDGSTGVGELQIPVTVTVTAPDTAAAIRFLHELRAGPRLLQIDSASGTIDPETGAVALSVTGLVFVRATP